MHVILYDGWMCGFGGGRVHGRVGGSKANHTECIVGMIIVLIRNINIYPEHTLGQVTQYLNSSGNNFKFML